MPRFSRIVKATYRDTVILCGRTPRPEPCHWCEKLHTKLCDFRMNSADEKSGRTCDAMMCDDHATSVGMNLDYCPNHKGAK